MMEGERGIMAQIRELLSEGLSSREVIELGYAPGTVYKAQRQLRRPKEGAIPKGYLDLSTDSPKLVGELSRLSEEKGRLEAEVERLSDLEEDRLRLEEEVSRLKSSLEELLESRQTEREKWRRREAELSEENGRLRGELQEVRMKGMREVHETRMENIRLRGYLSSKDCGWQRDYAEHLRKLEDHCCSASSAAVLTCHSHATGVCSLPAHSHPA